MTNNTNDITMQTYTTHTYNAPFYNLHYPFVSLQVEIQSQSKGSCFLFPARRYNCFLSKTVTSLQQGQSQYIKHTAYIVNYSVHIYDKTKEKQTWGLGAAGLFQDESLVFSL